MLFRMALQKIVCNIFLSCFPYNKKFFKGFLVQSPKILYIHCAGFCCLIVLLETPGNVILYVHICVMGFGWPISSNVFRKIMTYLPVTKNLRCLLLQKKWQKNPKCYNLCVSGHLGHYQEHLKVYSLLKNPAAWLCDYDSIRYYALVFTHKNMSEAWNLTTAFGYFVM